MDQEKIGKFIAKCRKDKKLTQAELAEKLGISEKSIGNWENGRNMPDLSLFKPLCNILNISINDLMSGEKVDNQKYIKTLEENIVNMVSNIERNKLKRKKIIILTLIGILMMMVIGRIFYVYYETDVKYDSRTMNCNIVEKELHFHIKGQSVLNTYYTSKIVDNKTIYFFHTTVNIYNKKRSNWEYSQSMASLLDNKDVQFSSFYRIDIESENIEVYYTDNSIKKIEKATKNELKKIMKNSYLMCSSNN